MNKKIHVIGAGLAGCEAAWFAANMGVSVTLYEMKPQRYSPAHHSPMFAELVCSNSLRSNQIHNAVGLLKEEMLKLGSLTMEAAKFTEVPAGAALAVDREKFSAYITEKIEKHPLIEVVREEVVALPEGITVVATGPLTSDRFSEYLSNRIGFETLHFFDAAAPIVDASTIDWNKVFVASRYDKGEACYVNCPMTHEEYDAFYQKLIAAEEAVLKEFDKQSQKELKVFEGCMPVEVMARRGYETLLYGPMKPVGLIDPRTGKEAFAVVQLRQENEEKTMYNMVGFQTHLTFPEQRNVFRMIPGLENADFFRYGVMHRNTFIKSPGFLNKVYGMKENPDVFFAGQMNGVEGYVESAASGIVAGINAAARAKQKEPILFDKISVIGAMAHYVSEGGLNEFQPMNANFGIIAPLETKIKGGKFARNNALAQRALDYIDSILPKLSEYYR